MKQETYTAFFVNCSYSDFNLIKCLLNLFLSKKEHNLPISAKIRNMPSFFNNLNVFIDFELFSDFLKFHNFIMESFSDVEDNKDLKHYDKDLEILNTALVIQWLDAEYFGLLVNNNLFVSPSVLNVSIKLSVNASNVASYIEDVVNMRVSNILYIMGLINKAQNARCYLLKSLFYDA